jgi:hypothetical protein
MISNRCKTHLLDETVPESQCGFRKNRGIVHQIFCARQIQKCKEQNKDLSHPLQGSLASSSSKAFDTVPCPDLWRVLPRIGIPSQMVQIIRCFHDGMNARLVDGKEEDDFCVSNGVKQGRLLVPSLFSFLFSLMLLFDLKDTDPGNRWWCLQLATLTWLVSCCMSMAALLLPTVSMVFSNRQMP